MIYKLSWDSDFFSKEIGKVEVIDTFDESSFYQQAKKYDMVYVFTSKPIDIKANLVDVKFIFEKKVHHDNKNKSAVKYFNNNLDDYNELLELAYVSGHESRFKKDNFFGEEKFKKLYQKWLDKNLNESNHHVLVYKNYQRTVGFVSYQINAGEAAIHLIAVNPNYQGQGIGKKLIQAVENKLPELYKLNVPTQKDNKSACKFYENYGFTLKQKQYIYHFTNDSI